MVLFGVLPFSLVAPRIHAHALDARLAVAETTGGCGAAAACADSRRPSLLGARDGSAVLAGSSLNEHELLAGHGLPPPVSDGSENETERPELTEEIDTPVLPACFAVPPGDTSGYAAHPSTDGERAAFASRPPRPSESR